MCACACARAPRRLTYALTVMLVKKLKCKGVITLCSPNYSCEFQQSGQNQYSRKSLIFRVQRQLLDNRSLRQTIIKYYKITCPFDIDIGPKRVQEDWPLEMLKEMLPLFSHMAKTCVKTKKLGNLHTIYQF